MINILRELCRNKKGRIEGASMADMLQMIWLEKMTCRLLVKSNGKSGTLSILDGELKSAKTKTHREQEAAMEILTWDNVTIELDENPVHLKHNLKVSTEEMLLENIRRREDKKEDTGKFNVPDCSLPKSELGNEISMNVSKLNKSIDTLRESLGEALLATDILGSTDLQSITGWNTPLAVTSLFGQIILSINQGLLELELPHLGKYCIFNLLDGKLVVLIPMGNFIWGILVDEKKVQLGLLLNVALPKAIADFEGAVSIN